MYWNEYVGLALSLPPGLTLTWDVLKYIFKDKDEVGMMININMRCIEM